MQTPKLEKKAVKVTLHGHSWTVYPVKSRNLTIFRVFHRVNGKRAPKTFMSLAEAKADAKNLVLRCFRWSRWVGLGHDT